MNSTWDSLLASNSMWEGALFGPDQKGEPSLSTWSFGKMDRRSKIE